MANIYTNQIYAFGPAQSLSGFITDRTGRAGEVEDWIATTGRAELRQTMPDLKDYVDIVFTASAKELEGLMAGLSERHEDLVITHAALELANGVAYAQVWSGGFVVGEFVMDDEELATCGTEDAVFDQLLSTVDAYEKDAISANEAALAS